MVKGSFYRIHIEEIAYYTKRPKGLFAAVGNLVDQKVMSKDEIGEYWNNRRWFEANLPIPPFCTNLKPTLPIPWFKNNAAGNEMFARMGFYLVMAHKYITSTNTESGEIVSEDDFQIGVTNSKHGGTGIATVAYANVAQYNLAR